MLYLILYFNTVVVLSVVRTTPVVKDVSGTARCSSIKCDTAFDTWSRSFIINNDIHTIIIEIESVVGIPSKSKLQSNAFNAFKLG